MSAKVVLFLLYFLSTALLTPYILRHSPYLLQLLPKWLAWCFDALPTWGNDRQIRIAAIFGFAVFVGAWLLEFALERP